MKCCPKVHIKQLRNNFHYICLCDRVGWKGGVTDEKGGGPGKGGGQDSPDPPPPLDTPMSVLGFIHLTFQIMGGKRCRKCNHNMSSFDNYK